MCLSPVRIPNPNFGSTVDLIKSTVDTESRYINVPCGVCNECLQMRQMSLIQRCRVMALDHYIYFCTLTYNPESLPVLSVGEYDIPYVDMSDLQKMFKRIRKTDQFGRPFKYFFVSERGKSRGRPHIHGLIFIPKFKDDDKLVPAAIEQKVYSVLFNEWRRNLGSNRNPVWQPLFSYRKAYRHGKLYQNFDCHYVVSHSTEHGSDDVAFYVSKYLLKGSDREKRLQQALSMNLDPDDYEEVWKTVRSRCICSVGFGAATDFEKSYVLGCIDRSADDPDGLKYFASDGSSQPISRYYRKFLDAPHAVRSAKARGTFSYDNRDISEKLRSLEKGSVIKVKVDNRDISDFYPD